MATQIIPYAEQAKQIQQQAQAYIPLLREMITGGKRLSDEQIAGRSVFAAQQGLDPISEVHTIVDRDGRTVAHTMSANGYRRKCLEQVRQDQPGANIDLEFVEIPKDKLPQGSFVGFECRLRDDASYTGWQKRVTQLGKVLREAMGGAVSYRELMDAAGPAPVFTGIGIVYQDELSPYKDKNYNPIERAKKRAEVNARHRRFPTNAPVTEGDGAAIMDQANMIDGVFTEGEPAPATKRAPAPATEESMMADLGFGDAPAPTEPGPVWYDADEPEQITETDPAMSYEDACLVQDKRGKFYKDAPDAVLAQIAAGLETDLRVPGLDEAIVSLKRQQLEAVTVIAAHRAGQS